METEVVGATGRVFHQVEAWAGRTSWVLLCLDPPAVVQKMQENQVSLCETRLTVAKMGEYAQAF